jgi:hypothetical protein
MHPGHILLPGLMKNVQHQDGQAINPLVPLAAVTGTTLTMRGKNGPTAAKTANAIQEETRKETIALTGTTIAVRQDFMPAIVIDLQPLNLRPSPPQLLRKQN